VLRVFVVFRTFESNASEPSFLFVVGLETKGSRVELELESDMSDMLLSCVALEETQN